MYHTYWGTQPPPAGSVLERDDDDRSVWPRVGRYNNIHTMHIYKAIYYSVIPLVVILFGAEQNLPKSGVSSKNRERERGKKKYVS